MPWQLYAELQVVKKRQFLYLSKRSDSSIVMKCKGTQMHFKDKMFYDVSALSIMLILSSMRIHLQRKMLKKVAIIKGHL